MPSPHLTSQGRPAQRAPSLSPGVVLPDNILRCMDPKARAALGKAGMTAEEAQAAVDARGEKELQQQCRALLSLHGLWHSWAKTHQRSTLLPGTPDFLFCFKRQDGSTVAMAWECKVAKGRLSPEQERTHEAMRLNGWQVHVVRTLEEARALLPEWRCDPVREGGAKGAGWPQGASGAPKGTTPRST